MKIACLSVFYPYRGGIAQFNASLYRALEKQHDVAAWTFTRQYPDLLFPGKTQLVTEDDNADCIPAKRMLDSINPFSWNRTAKDIIKFEPDLLLIQNWMPFFAPSFGYVAGKLRKAGAATISILANVKPHEQKPGDDLLNKWFVNKNDGLVVLADATKKDLLELKPNAIYFKHPHPNYEHFGEKIPKEKAREALGIPTDKKVLFFFGLIRKYKGLDILIKAMQGLEDDFFLLVAGESYGSFAEYQALLNEYVPENRRLLHLEYIKDSEVAQFFSAADVCVLPYRTATQSGIVGIAYQFGLPVISTDVGGLREVIEPYGAGIVVKEPDPDQLRTAILRMFLGDFAEKCADRADDFRREYTWDSFANGIVGLYDKIKKQF